jgi:hypothetical protein
VARVQVETILLSLASNASPPVGPDGDLPVKGKRQAVRAFRVTTGTPSGARVPPDR